MRGRRVLIGAVASVAALGSMPAVLMAPAASAKTVVTSKNLIVNGGFESGTAGWRTNARGQKLSKSPSAHSGKRAARLSTSRRAGHVVLNDRGHSARTSRANQRYRLTAWVRTNRPGVRGQLKIRAVKARNVQRLSRSFVLRDRRWHRVVVEGTVKRTGSQLDINVLGGGLGRRSRLLVDDVSLVTVKRVADPKPDPGPSVGTLSNGCGYTSRGIPACGAYVGATYYGEKGNGDPSDWESELGRQLGVHRLFFQASQVDGAVAKATADAQAKRVSWVSFKPPYSWSDMAAGRGDAWARETAARLAAVPGPVWVAVHHEPENDSGDLADWTRMQARMAPIFRSAGSNVAYSIILMGYHQFFGTEEMSLQQLWPKDTKVDIAGFDVYDSFGVVRNGKVGTKHVDFRSDYFEKIQSWASKQGVAWGLAETGFTKEGLADSPGLMAQVYRDLIATDGIAYTYFDCSVGASADWSLTDSLRRNAFADIHRTSPTMG